MGYILLLDNDKRWTVDPKALQYFLSAKFKIDSFSKILDAVRPYSYEWKISEPIYVEGFLHKSGDSIHIDGVFQHCVDFVLTIKDFIPPTERMMFFDDSYNH